MEDTRNIEVDESTEEQINLESIPGQIGAAVLYADGKLAGPCTGKLTEKDTTILYQMLLEIGMLLEKSTSGDTSEAPCSSEEFYQEGLRRITVSFPSVRFAAAVAKDGCIYIVKTKVTALS